MLLLLMNKFLWKLLVDINGTDKMYLFDYYGLESVTLYYHSGIVTFSQLNVKFERNRQQQVKRV